VPYGGGDPVLWPIDLIYKAKIAHADWVSRHPDDPPAFKQSAAIGEKLVPIMPSLLNVEVAYEVTALEYARSQPKGVLDWAVKGTLENHLQFHQDDVDAGKAHDLVRLSEQEANIVKQLCETPRYSADRQGKLTRQPTIPYDPVRRAYSISKALEPVPTKPATS
jgi:hypothetical protein